MVSCCCQSTTKEKRTPRHLLFPTDDGIFRKRSKYCPFNGCMERRMANICHRTTSWSSVRTVDVDSIDLYELTENFKSPCRPYALRTICGEGRAKIEDILEAQTSVSFRRENLVYRIAERIALKTSHAFCILF